MFSQLFHVVLYQPLFNIFVGLYNIVPGHDVGVVILIITILIRLLVYPLTASSIKSQKSLQELQPKLEELKKQFNEAMGDLVVLAADASDLTEDQKKEAGLLGEKAKYAWSKIVEKRPANENMHIDDQNKYITDIVEEQLKKVGS